MNDPYEDQLKAARYKAERDQARQRIAGLMKSVDDLDDENEHLRDMLNDIAWKLGIGREAHYLSGDNYDECHKRVLGEISKLTGPTSYDVAQVTTSAYDLLPEEDREALRWVREHGGLEEVKRAMQDSDNRRVELCSALGIDTVTGWSDAVVEMDKRLMPPDYEWPRFEDGELVRFGDMVELNSKVAKVYGVFISKHGFVLWGESGEDTGADMRFDYPVFDYSGWPRAKRPKPDPIGADGLPIHEEDIVYDKHTGDRFEVSGFSYDCVVCYDLDSCESDIEIEPFQLTHTKPEIDSWERIEEDLGDEMAKQQCGPISPELACKLAGKFVRRCKALAERSE